MQGLRSQADTIFILEDVIEDLKPVALLLGFSGYQPLVRAYIAVPDSDAVQHYIVGCRGTAVLCPYRYTSRKLRDDLERLKGNTVSI